MSDPFNSRWPLAPIVIDYIASAINDTKLAACIALQTCLFDGRVKAEGPLHSETVVPIKRQFWQFALPEVDGRASNISSRETLSYFMVSAEDVLREWPQGVANSLSLANEKASSFDRKPFPKARMPELRKFLVSDKHRNLDIAQEQAEKHFGANIDREWIRVIRDEQNIKGKAGRPRKSDR